jgi:hypothetical protein
MLMIVIGVDVDKHSLTGVAVDEGGRQLDQMTVEYPDASFFAWAGRLGEVRLWAVEDCRHVTRALAHTVVMSLAMRRSRRYGSVVPSSSGARCRARS